MAYPVSHKTVFVLDHSPSFSMPCDVVDFDSIKSSMQAAARQIPIAPIYKTMWTSVSESLLEYCRIVWDIFPPDCQEQKLIRFVLSGSDTQFLNRWDPQDQTVEVLKNALARVGRPEPESRRKSAQAKGYNISNGIEAGMKILCEYTDIQKLESQKLKICDRSPIGVLNRGRIIVLTHLESQEHLNSILEAFKSQFFLVNQFAAASKTCKPLNSIDLLLIHCFTQNDSNNFSGIICENNQNEVSSLPLNITYQVLGIQAGQFMCKKFLSLALKHYNLASTTVTGIPMKEEQNASSSANYDVELFHRANVHKNIYKYNYGNVISKKASKYTTIVHTYKVGCDYPTITLKWCNPRINMVAELQNCTSISRVTPTDLSSRPTLCMINFLLNGKGFMLELQKADGSKILCHWLTSHSGEIFLHELSSNSLFDDTPMEYWKAFGGTHYKMVDYRISELIELMESNRLSPSGKDKTPYEHNYPLERACNRLTNHIRMFPFTKNSTIIFNMVAVDPLLKIMIKDALTDQNIAKCKNIIYQLIRMESKGDHLPVPIPLTPKGFKSTKKNLIGKEEQYKMMFGELEKYIAAHCRTDDHKKVLDFLLEVIGKSDRISPSSSRNNLSSNDANVSTDDKDKVELDVALQQLDKYSAMTEREKSDFNLSKDGVLRSTVESPMSPTAFGSEPLPKKPRLGIAGGKSLLEIWTTRIEKENAKKHVPFAGERSLGEKAKLYLSLERKDDGNNDRPGATGAEM